MQAFEFGGTTNPVGMTSTRVPSFNPNSSVGNSYTSSVGNPVATYPAHHPSSAPSGGGAGLNSTGGATTSSRLNASTSYAGGGGAAFRHPSPPPINNYSTIPATTTSSTYNRTPSFNANAAAGMSGTNASTSAFTRSTSGATFTEAQHLETLSQHRAHNAQMHTIASTSTNSTAIPSSGGYTSSSGYGASSSTAMNPYCPQYPSTGDAAADAQLAAMYKARDEMRAKLQQAK